MSVTRIQLRRGTALEWASSNDVILAAGEIGFETDTNNFKIGNGEDTWEQLSYFKNVDELNSLSDNNLSNYARLSQLTSYIQTNKIGAINGVASLDANGQIPITQLQTIISGADESLNTLNEIAQALSDDETGLDALLTEINTKVSKTGDTIKGNILIENSVSPGTGVGRVTANTLRLLSTAEADLSSTTHALQIGADDATKLKIDQNEIQAIDSANAANSLQLNPHGGNVVFGSNIVSVSSTGVSVTSPATFSGIGSGLTGIPNSATSATDAATASAIVARNGSGAFTATGITLLSNSVSHPINPARTFYLDTNRTLTNTANLSQSIFGQGTSLVANTRYAIEMFVAIGKSATASAVNFAITGTGTLALSNSALNTSFITTASGTATPATAVERYLQLTTGLTTTTPVLVTGTTATGHFLKVTGAISVSTAGVLNPFIQFVTAVAPVIQAGSYIRVTEIFGTTAGAWA